jgi:LacI family transcriptional regulator
MPEPVTLKDVARLAGVSTATVARVLHDNGYVSEAVRARVEDVIRSTGYRLNVQAQGLRKRRTMTLGHLLYELVPNPFFPGVAEGVEREASRLGYGVLTFNSHRDAQRETLGVETLIGRRVDAIIFTVPIDAENVRRAAEAGIPVVQVERLTGVASHGVVVDNLTGASAAVEHLIEIGHRRIGYIGGNGVEGRPGPPSGRSIEEERLAGYRDVLGRHGLSVDEALVLAGSYREFRADGYRCMRRLLSLERPPTAVFATGDLFAAGALQAIHEAGLRVPDDVSIIGFDDTLASFLSPPLTTVALPIEEMGRAAARIAAETSPEGDDAGHRIANLTARLVHRSSTAPPGRREA